MKLHHYKEEFNNLISIVANKLHIPESAVVYWTVRSYTHSLSLYPNRWGLSSKWQKKVIFRLYIRHYIMFAFIIARCSDKIKPMFVIF
mgnify:CR=1 FL=1